MFIEANAVDREKLEALIQQHNLAQQLSRLDMMMREDS